MSRTSSAWLLILVACHTPVAPHIDLSHTPEMKREMLCGLQNQSTAPTFVLLDVNPHGVPGWRGVVESVAVAEAIALDHGWPSPRGHWKEIIALLSKPEAVEPRPSTPEAQESLRPLYTLQELEEARSFLSGFSDTRVRDELSSPSSAGPIRPFYSESSFRFFPRQAALAHALIERGFLPERGDYAPVLRIVQSNCEEGAAQQGAAAAER